MYWRKQPSAPGLKGILDRYHSGVRLKLVVEDKVLHFRVVKRKGNEELEESGPNVEHSTVSEVKEQVYMFGVQVALAASVFLAAVVGLVWEWMH
jgi:hypothetical protein